MGRRLLPQTYSWKVHDAHPHAQRFCQQRTVAGHRGNVAPHRQRRSRHHHPAADRIAWIHAGHRARDLGKAARRGSAQPPDRHGQRAQHQRLSARRADTSRAARRVAHRLRARSTDRRRRRQSGIHQPAEKTERHDHRMPRELHALRIAGCGAGSSRRGRASGVQRAGRRQDGLGRIHRRVAARRVRRAASRGCDRGRIDPNLPGPRAPRCARQMPVRVLD